jgi:hypothetical protein
MGEEVVQDKVLRGVSGRRKEGRAPAVTSSL